MTGLNRVLGEASRVIGLLRGDEYYFTGEGSDGTTPPPMGPQGLVSPACLARMIGALNEIALKQAIKLLKVRSVRTYVCAHVHMGRGVGARIRN